MGESLLFSITVGVLLTWFGVCLLGNLWNLTSRLFDFYSGIAYMGTATVNTLRFIGAIGIFIGLFWIATSLSEIP